MKLDFSVQGFNELMSGMLKAPAIVDEVERVAIRDSALYVEGEIKLGTPVVTGRLRAAWDHRVLGGAGAIEARVYNEVSYAPFVEYGRGPIVPVNAQALRFKVGGKTIFRKRVGPAKGRHMAYEGLRRSQSAIESIWNKRVAEGLARIAKGAQ